ncbi:Ribokinase-like protein [Cylindrobasidium torrendii FP15055 ss-10]|uniref:Adenosine kinase n=1 Tax=Cylindrobasidium torrendii FP15055 ss-10 TaxID=1314674 RepID=A0A0D7BQT0_9AGAR|nr:Ribokinase-like protein [Cylindrobasidium torrendii FP15055 ss-10]
MAIPILFCIGNALIDIIVTGSNDLLAKYDLQPNGAILANEAQNAIYQDIIKNYTVTYVAGGIQNAARSAAYILPPGSVVYTACVGDDDFAEQLKAANAKEGVLDVNQVVKGEQTGACAVIITGHNRSLCTSLRSAVLFDEAHLESEPVKSAMNGAKLVYFEAYFVAHGAGIFKRLAEKMYSAGKICVLNFSAPYILQSFNFAIQDMLPYIDMVICNETEAVAWAKSNGHHKSSDLADIGKAIAISPGSDSARRRIVIITHGAQPTIVVSSDTLEVQEYPVRKLEDSKIVDTNAAGDAFAGGLLGAYVLGEPFDECIDIGQKMAAMVIQQVGAQYQWPKVKLV